MWQVTARTGISLRARLAGLRQGHSPENCRAVHGIHLEYLSEIGILHVQVDPGDSFFANAQGIQPFHLTIRFNEHVQGWSVAESLDLTVPSHDDTRDVP
jgi:hypothetical protein